MPPSYPAPAAPALKSLLAPGATRNEAVLVLLMAFLPRLMFVLTVPAKPVNGRDNLVYEQTAFNLLHRGKLYSREGRATRPPLYPCFVALIYLVAGVNHSAVFVTQAFLGSLGVLCLFYALRILGHGVAWIFALIFSAHPLMLFYTKQILTEPFQIFLLCVLTYFAFCALEKKLKRNVWPGALLGAAILCRADAAVLLALYMVGFFLFYPGQRIDRTRMALLCATAAFLVLLPWLVRNCFVLGAPVLASEGGETLYIGQNPEATGRYMPPPPPPADLAANEVGMNNFYFRKAVAFMRDHPGASLSLIPKKQMALWSPNRNWVLDGADLLLLPLSALGIFIALRDRARWKFYYFLLSPIIAVHVTAALFVGQSRFRAPMTPFFAAFAAVALASLVDFIPRMRAAVPPR